MVVGQGDIIQIEKLKGYFLVVSKDFFNSTYTYIYLRLQILYILKLLEKK